jgi:AAA15 family ATPase/GTPase/GTPase SAR1 family protein
MNREEIEAQLQQLPRAASGEIAQPLNRVRVIFIGDGEAGKTSLIRVLNHEALVDGIEAKTPGIEIREWQVPGTQITASFWDFGGQVMVHATHQLFLRESCLYVLLVSAHENEKATERAEYWLEHVKSFGKGAPVLIVANKADKEPVRLDEALLLEKYPNIIKGFFQLACTQAQGRFRNQFEQFQTAFCQQLQAVGLHQVLFEKAHFAVLENLRQRTPQQAFLSHQDYADVCTEHGVAQEGGLDRVWLLDILDKLGVIVHFPDMLGTEEYILNPRWLTYGVYTIMYNGNPRMSRQQVIHLLGKNPVTDQYGNQLNYPPSKCLIVFEAMRRYKLCYFLPRDPEQLIIPALLPSDIKQHGFDTENALEFHYQFESFLPRHLISELIVECHEDIQNTNGEDIVWQHGMLLDNKNHGIQALIHADYHFRRLIIWLTSHPAAAEFLAILRDKVEKIVARIAINYTQNIRLPNAALLDQSTFPREPEWANFRQILAQRNKGRTSYDHESGSEYSIAKILGLFEQRPIITNSPVMQLTAERIINSFNIITPPLETKRNFHGLNSLAIQNFRVFEDFKVNKLGKVNLIVGKNNAGKSSFLEALRIYASNGRERLMQELAAGHDERFQFDEYTEEELQSDNLPYAGFFSNRRLPPDNAKGIVIGESSDSKQALAINVVFLTNQKMLSLVPRSFLSQFQAQDLIAQLIVKKDDQQIFPLNVSFNSQEANYSIPEPIPCSMVPTQLVSFDKLADVWDEIIALTDNELIVKDALKLITPEFEDISFVKANGNSLRPQGDVRRTVNVRLAGLPHPVPINSMGEGMLRILQIILKVFPAKDGFLLIDEFENGLHYSVQEKVWQMVFDLAEKLNIQVFATTHSWDCITSFAQVARQREADDGILFRVGRSVRTSDKGKVIATVFSGTSLFDLTQADIEVR